MISLYSSNVVEAPFQKLSDVHKIVSTQVFRLYYYSFNIAVLHFNLKETKLRLSQFKGTLRALTLMGSTKNNPVLDQLAVIHLDN